MPTITTNDLKNGMSLDLDDGLFDVVEFQHVKPGKGGAFVRTTLKNVRTGSGRRAHLPGRREGRAGDDRQAGDAVPLPRRATTTSSWTTPPTTSSRSAPASLGDAANYLVESADAILKMYGDEIVGVELPAAVELAISDTEPGVQGDRVSGARKPATLETGLVVQVPLFVGPGRPRQGRHPHRRVPDPGVTPPDDASRQGGVGSRREARERAFHLLYEAEIKDVAPEELLAGLPLAPDPFAVELVRGVGAHRDELDALVARFARNWDGRPHARPRPGAAAPRRLRAGPPPRRAHRRRHLRGRRAGQALLHRRQRPLRQRRAGGRRRRGAPLTDPRPASDGRRRGGRVHA